jgi:hypothetical protein
LIGHHILCDLFWDSHGVKEVKALVMTASVVKHGQSSTPGSADHFCMDLCGDSSMKAATVVHVTVWNIGRLLHRESFTFPYEKACFFHDK